MRKLTLLSPINAYPSKRVSISQLLRLGINQQRMDGNAGWDASVGNQPIPLLLNDDTDVSGRNGVSVLESEFLAVSVI